MIIPILILAVEKMKNKRQDVDMEKLHCMMMPNRFRFLQAEKPLDEKSGKLLVFFYQSVFKTVVLIKMSLKIKIDPQLPTKKNLIDSMALTFFFYNFSSQYSAGLKMFSHILGYLFSKKERKHF